MSVCEYEHRYVYNYGLYLWSLQLNLKSVRTVSLWDRQAFEGTDSISSILHNRQQ